MIEPPFIPQYIYEKRVSITFCINWRWLIVVTQITIEILNEIGDKTTDQNELMWCSRAPRIRYQKKRQTIWSNCGHKKLTQFSSVVFRRKNQKKDTFFLLCRWFDLFGFFRIVFPFSEEEYTTSYHLPFAHRCRPFQQYLSHWAVNSDSYIIIISQSHL